MLTFRESNIWIFYNLYRYLVVDVVREDVDILNVERNRKYHLPQGQGIL
jgi:hypothetical protein